MKKCKLYVLLVIVAMVLLGEGCNNWNLAPKPSSTMQTQETQETQEFVKWIWQGNDLASPPTSIYKYTGSVGATLWWRDWVKEITHGRLIIEVAKPEAIVSPNECFKAVSKGAIDGAEHVYAASHAEITPESDILIGLPMAWTVPELAFDALYRRGMYDIVKEIYAEHNLYPIIYPMGSLYQVATIKPLDKPEDIKGMKIRAVGVYGEYIKALGGIPVSMPSSYIYKALKNNLIDGALIGFYGGIITDKGIEVCKSYVGEPNLNTVINVNIINLDKWNALPSDIREIIDSESKFILQAGAYEFHLQEEQAIALAQREGRINMTYWSDEDQAKVEELVMNQIWPAVAAKSPRCSQMVDMIRSQLRDLGKLH